MPNIHVNVEAELKALRLGLETLEYENIQYVELRVRLNQGDVFLCLEWSAYDNSNFIYADTKYQGYQSRIIENLSELYDAIDNIIEGIPDRAEREIRVVTQMIAEATGRDFATLMELSQDYIAPLAERLEEYRASITK